MKAKKIILGLVIVGALAACVGTPSSNNETKTTKTSDTTSEKKEEKKVYHIGEVVPVGNVEYTVNGIEQTDTIGDQYVNATAQNHFLIVSVTITNKGNEALNVSDSYLKLKNGDKTYESSSDSIMYLGEESIFYESINPDASFTGKVAYDITQETIDSPNLQLQVQTGAFGTEKEVINLK